MFTERMIRMAKRGVLLTAVLIGLLAIGSMGVAHQGNHPPGNPGSGPNSGYGPGSPIVGAACGMTQGGGGMMGGGMRGPAGYQLGCGFNPGFVASTPTEAAQAATAFLDETFWADRALNGHEVSTFSNHYAVVVTETDTGDGAMVLLVDRLTGVVSPEPGSNMMWNGRYDTRGGGMYGGAVTRPDEMPITMADARQSAEQFAQQYAPDAQIARVTPFYGHYVVALDQDGGQRRILSVDGYTGQVWYHSWHGSFEGAQALGNSQ